MFKTFKILFLLALFMLTDRAFATHLSLSPAAITLQMEPEQRQVLTINLARSVAGLEEDFTVNAMGDSQYLANWKKEFSIPRNELETSYRFVLDTSGAELGTYQIELTFLPETEEEFVNFGLTATVDLEVLAKVEKPLEFTELENLAEMLVVTGPDFQQQVINTGDEVSFDFAIQNQTDQAIKQLNYKTAVLHRGLLLDSQTVSDPSPLKAGEERFYAYDYKFSSIGSYIITVSIGDLSREIQVTVYPKTATILIVASIIAILIALFCWSKNRARVL